MTFVTAGPLRLWTERVGDPGHPAVLLVVGSQAQGFTCPDALIDRLVAGGLQVIRYDHRDTGQSSVVDFDRHPYGLADLARDALAVLDGYELPSAHIAGMSLGGAIAQWLGVHAPDRVASLTLISTSPMSHDPGPVWERARAGLPAEPDVLPPPRPVMLREMDDVELFRAMNGDVLPFDEPAVRAMLDRCRARATDPSAAAHHGLIARYMGPDLLVPLSTIIAPTTIVHGDQDPVVTLPHAEALAAAIPHARLRIVPGMGHSYFSPGLPELLADLISSSFSRTG